MAASTARDLAATIPIGMPMASATAAAASTSARVNIAASQRSRLMTNSRPNNVNSATRQPAMKKAMTASTATVSNAGGVVRANCNTPTMTSTAALMKSKNSARNQFSGLSPFS